MADEAQVTVKYMVAEAQVTVKYMVAEVKMTEYTWQMKLK